MSATLAWLLDVNTLLALVWPEHRFHEAAHRWLAGRPGDGWATCAFTQTAFVRLSCNPAVVSSPVSGQEASRILALNTQHPQHRYWQDCPALDQLSGWAECNLQGYRQVADAYLLALTQHHGGRLATFDRGLSSLLAKPADRRRWVEVIPP